MGERAFVIMKIGAKDSIERKRADEIFTDAARACPGRVGRQRDCADLHYLPGAITPKMLSELLDARRAPADLTGRNPNVFYEPGVAHSFTRPLISIADSTKSLPFDTKDERVIEIGDYQASGLRLYQQVEKAGALLRESLKAGPADRQHPPSPLRELAANRSVHQLAPTWPIAADQAQMRKSIEDIRKRVPGRIVLPRGMQEEIEVLRMVIECMIGDLNADDFSLLEGEKLPGSHRRWVGDLRKRWLVKTADPWASDDGGYSDEPPF